MGPGQAFRLSGDDARAGGMTRAGRDDARWKGGGRPSPQPAMPCLRGDKMWRQFFSFPTTHWFHSLQKKFSNFFAGKYSPLLRSPLQSTPSLSREPDAHRVFGRAAETSPSGSVPGGLRVRDRPAVPGALGDSVAGIAEKPPGLLVRPGKAPNRVQPGRAGRPSDRPTVGTDSGGARWTRLKKIEWLGQRAPLPNLPKRPDAKAGVAAMARACLHHPAERIRKGER